MSRQRDSAALTRASHGGCWRPAGWAAAAGACTRAAAATAAAPSLTARRPGRSAAGCRCRWHWPQRPTTTPSPGTASGWPPGSAPSRPGSLFVQQPHEGRFRTSGAGKFGARKDRFRLREGMRVLPSGTGSCSVLQACACASPVKIQDERKIQSQLQ